MSERKDQETAHTTIVDTETQYFHQRRREAVSGKEGLLHQQKQQLTAQLHQKEEELALAHQQIQKLEVLMNCFSCGNSSHLKVHDMSIDSRYVSYYTVVYYRPLHKDSGR